MEMQKATGVSRGLLRELRVGSSCDGFALRWLCESQDVVGRLLCPCSGYEYRPLVGAQHFEPAREIPGVMQLTIEPAMGAQECRAHLRDQLLRGVSVISEPLPQLAIASRRMRTPMRQLM